MSGSRSAWPVKALAGQTSPNIMLSTDHIIRTTSGSPHCTSVNVACALSRLRIDPAHAACAAERTCPGPDTPSRRTRQARDTSRSSVPASQQAPSVTPPSPLARDRPRAWQCPPPEPATEPLKIASRFHIFTYRPNFDTNIVCFPRIKKENCLERKSQSLFRTSWGGFLMWKRSTRFSY